MTRAVFETMTIADSLKKAEAVAPRPSAKSHAFDVAAGIMLELFPNGNGGGQCRVRSTNLEVFYDEVIDVIEMEGPATQWRIPTSKFTGIIAALPMGTGGRVEMVQDGEWLNLRSKRTKGRVMRLPAMGYPTWEWFSDETLTTVQELGEKILQISWACDDQMEPYTGVYFDGQYAMGATQKRAGVVPCPIAGLDGPITVPAKVLGPVIRSAIEAKIGVIGNHLAIAPDPYTRIRCTLYDKPIPSPRGFMGIAYDSAVEVERKVLSEAIKRMMNITRGSDEIVVIHMMLTGTGMSLRVQGSDFGESIEEVIDVTGTTMHAPVILRFVPTTLIDAISRVPSERIFVRYNSSGKDKAVRADSGIAADGTSQYAAWFVQFKEGAQQ
ncbi:DNA polymerase III sliding clamp beta [Rhodococcus phage Reynauld]|uniref:DNA polymerase III sliding clamp beta n=1 Tax=Rhodococcus phage Reynauld TaxID=3062845 RepID=A0ACD4UHK7_9CAUD|nr:DNA polymerase III sliding clamp beta [Rhodococcus phage Reynauld]